MVYIVWEVTLNDQNGCSETKLYKSKKEKPNWFEDENEFK